MPPVWLELLADLRKTLGDSAPLGIGQGCAHGRPAGGDRAGGQVGSAAAVRKAVVAWHRHHAAMRLPERAAIMAKKIGVVRNATRSAFIALQRCPTVASEAPCT